jgi:single-stranded-DNA-specific exonuclease
MSEKKWIIRAKRADFYALGEKFHIDPVVARLLVNRDIAEEDFEEFLHPEEAKFHDPCLIEDMNQAVRVVIHGIEEGHKMRIISDYDVDGVMSNYILYTGLRRIGADVDYVIPHRVRDGYGISDEIVDNAINDGISTIITCDNGIAAYDAVKKAKDAGIAVVVTDHHQVPFNMENGEKQYILPPADAILNSKKETCNYPYKELCGAGVAYKFVECLYDKRGIPVEELLPFIDFVAIATICDVVPLTGENRTFVVKGLPRLRLSENEGIRALIRVNELSDHTINAGHVGFRIGPCINASGRLESAELSMQLFLEENGEAAFSKAEELKAINDERKILTIQGVDKASELINECINDKVYVIYIPDCHESLA